MSLATITIEQNAPAKWIAWIEAGYPTCTRQQVMAITLPSLMIAIARTYQDMVPERQIGIKLESEDLWPSAAPKVKHVMSDEHKRKMAEGRERGRIARQMTRDERLET